LVLSWEGTNFILQQTPDLSQPDLWTNATVTPTIIDNTVTALRPTRAGQMFFRLVLQ
jgi:hypothetical protein